MKKSSVVVLMALAVILSACASPSPTAAPAPTQPPAPAATEEPTTFPLTVINSTSNYTICYFYAGPSSSPEWGEDRLGAENVIAPGQSFSIDVLPDTYVIKLDDCNNNELTSQYGLDLQNQGLEFTFSEDLVAATLYMPSSYLYVGDISVRNNSSESLSLSALAPDGSESTMSTLAAGEQQTRGPVFMTYISCATRAGTSSTRRSQPSLPDKNRSSRLPSRAPLSPWPASLPSQPSSSTRRSNRAPPTTPRPIPATPGAYATQITPSSPITSPPMHPPRRSPSPNPSTSPG